MGLPLFVAKLIGKGIANKLGLQEGPLETGKKWYRSQTILAGLVVFLRGVYVLAQTTIAPQFGWSLPDIPAWVDGVLTGALGIATIDGRVKATKSIE